MKKAGYILEFIGEKTVKLMILVIAGVLAFWSARYTYVYPVNYSLEKVSIEHDSLLKNLLVFAVLFIAIYGLQALVLRGTEEQKKKRVLTFALIDIALVGGLLIWYVANNRIPPYWDQAQAYLDALSFKNGDYSDMLGYLGMYPQQYGLTFIYELMFLFTPDEYTSIQYLNVVFVLVIIFFSYRIADQLFHNQTVNLYCIIATTMFFPMHIYVSFVYGDIASTALAILGIWIILKWRSTKKIKYALISLIPFSMAYLFRKNTLIVLIAVFLVLLLDAWKRMNRKVAVLGLLVLVIPMISMEGVKLSYEIRSGNQVSDGIPAVMWIAMGMQESDNGCGVFTGYTESIYRGMGESDSDKTSRIGVEYIQGRVEEFLDDTAMALDFYKAKVQGQWIEPTYSSLMETSKAITNPTGIVQAIYYGDARSKIFEFLNCYNFIIYVGVALYALVSFHRRDKIRNLMLLVAIVGGFLFSILWEAKGRYVLPYVVFMLPYMCQGIYRMQILIKTVFQNLFAKREEDNS